MKTLTENQQAIIESLTSEFNRINNVPKQKRSFNLIDLAPLEQKSLEIQHYKEVAEADKKLWDKIAMDEADRIVKLLQEDLPHLVVERFGKSNGHHDLPVVSIQPRSGNVHWEYCVRIEVKVNTETIKQGHGCYYHKGVSLGYEHGCARIRIRYNSIEELFEKSQIRESIRKTLVRI